MQVLLLSYPPSLPYCPHFLLSSYSLLRSMENMMEEVEGGSTRRGCETSGQEEERKERESSTTNSLPLVVQDFCHVSVASQDVIGWQVNLGRFLPVRRGMTWGTVRPPGSRGTRRGSGGRGSTTFLLGGLLRPTAGRWWCS